MSAPLKHRHAVLFGLTALCATVMVLVGRRPTPQQLMTLAPVVERGTEVLKAVDVVGQQVTRLSPEELAQLDEEIQGRMPWAQAEVSASDQAYAEGVLVRLDSFTLLSPRPRLRLIASGVPNAFALPGGTILLTTGMIEACRNEAELASVIAHEMGHHKLGHPLARLHYERLARKLGGPLMADLASLGYTLYARGYAARDEEEADRQGLGMAAMAGYHPQAAQRLMARMEARFGRTQATPSDAVEEAVGAAGTALRNYLATHPPFPDRIQKLERARVELGLRLDQRWFLGARNHVERVSALRCQPDEDFRQGPLD